MIFNTSKDIERDIKSKITNYIKQDNNCEDMKRLISILSSYLYEMKIIKEIESYTIDEINKNKINILFYKDNNSYKFGISMDLELRNLKINKIISSNVLD